MIGIAPDEKRRSDERMLQPKDEERLCQYVTDWTCDDEGDPDHELYCRKPAEWRNREDGMLSCSDCKSEFSAADQLAFDWIEATELHSPDKEKSGA